MMEWQLIETAPKDGTTILACVAGKEPSTARWLVSPMGREGWQTVYAEEFEEEQDFEDYMCANVYDPTHWMVLPASPKVSLMMKGRK